MSKDIVYCNNYLFCGDTDCEKNPCHIKDDLRNHRFAKYPECKRKYFKELRDLGHVEKGQKNEQDS